MKQSPLDGINFLLQDLNSIQAELSDINTVEKAQTSQKRVYCVEFREESCLIRASNPSYTFAELTNDAALYFNLIPEDCLLRDESNTIWSSNLRVIDESDPKINKLVLGLKYGRVARNPQASEINSRDLAAHLKLETRIQQMTKWVIDRGRSGQKRGIRNESILKRVSFFIFYATFLFLLFDLIFSP